ncbi:MAG: hypothetical protein LBU04_02780 [Christensenellaceae bacterium]|jgi:hypothetical protein|nr:hypothetical protein [Christensenellaceae bacterium]
MRSNLKEFFSSEWRKIYSIALIRAIYDCLFRRLQQHYDDSILSHMFPDISFAPLCVTSLLSDLGHDRQSIRKYMLKSVREFGRFILIVGHRILSSFATTENAKTRL